MNTEAKPVLSTEQIEEFNERGILQVNFGFSEALLDRIRRKIWRHYDPAFRRGELQTTRVQDGWKLVDEVRQLATDSRVTSALAQLLGRTALPFQTLNFPVGTSQLAHSDTIHFSTIPAGYMAGVWVALEDIDEDNGPLVYYPGSHKLPYYGMQDLDLEPGVDNYDHYEQRIQALIAEHGLQPEYGVVPKGTAIIWHANVLHGGAPQKDRSRSRHSQVTHYYFEGCRYYTPMESTADAVTFRDPQWIPARADLQLRWQQSRLRQGLSHLAGRLRGRKS